MMKETNKTSPIIHQVQYSETTHDVRITVTPRYVSDQSAPHLHHYFFSYHIEIENLSLIPIQLISRHWTITDGLQKSQEVIGEGVIGLQPVISPQEKFEYSSFCPLPTPTGNMRGWFYFEQLNGDPFKVRIPLFFLRQDEGLVYH